MEEELDNFESKQLELMETYHAQLEMENKRMYEEENPEEGSFFSEEK